MRDLDLLLSHLRDEPLPVPPETFGTSVMSGVMLRRETSLARRSLMVAVMVAAIIGLGGSLVPSSRAAAEPLFGVPESAPSRLLAD